MTFEGAACANTSTDLFFSEDDRDKALAKAICGLCPQGTRQACLEMAVLTGTYEGVFGGLTGRQRSRQSSRIRQNLKLRCDNCGTLFTPKFMTNRYCSDPCQITVQTRKRMDRKHRAMA